MVHLNGSRDSGNQKFKFLALKAEVVGEVQTLQWRIIGEFFLLHS
jgi:hypothetical protein